jgi:hypothetical protein
MLNELHRRNNAPSTIRSYLGAVEQFAEYFHRSPELLGPAHLRRYQLYLLQEKKLEPATVWNCPHCHQPMHLVERLTAAQLFFATYKEAHAHDSS